MSLLQHPMEWLIMFFFKIKVCTLPLLMVLLIWTARPRSPHQTILTKWLMQMWMQVSLSYEVINNSLFLQVFIVEIKFYVSFCSCQWLNFFIVSDFMKSCSSCRFWLSGWELVSYLCKNVMLHLVISFHALFLKWMRIIFLSWSLAKVNSLVSCLILMDIKKSLG